MFRANIKKRCPLLLSVAALLAFFITQPTIGTNPETGRSTGTTLSARNNQPDSPLAMAVQLEKLLAQGAGMIMPFPGMLVKQDDGIVPLDATQTAFSPEFLVGLTPETVDSATVWRTTLRVDDDNGSVIFYNADNEPFWVVEADPAIYCPEWVARIFNVGQLMHCSYLLSLTVKGRVEDHNAGYDKVSVRSYMSTALQEDVHFFEGHGNYNGCTMISEQATTNIWFWSNGSIRLRYDTGDGLYHTDAYAEITAAAFVDFLRVESINATSPVAGTSGNPPPFKGHKPWLFNVTHSPQPDKHMVVFYKDVVDSSFNVDDFN